MQLAKKSLNEQPTAEHVRVIHSETRLLRDITCLHPNRGSLPQNPRKYKFVLSEQVQPKSKDNIVMFCGNR